jgi:hypothetical protein
MKRDPVDDLLDAIDGFVLDPSLLSRELLRGALNRWVKREVRAHALSGEHL